MNNTELFIENKRLDITEELSSLLNYCIDDIKDIGSRNTTFSKTIILPGTANNNLLFGSIFDVRIANTYDPLSDNVGTNFNAAVAADALIFQSGLQVFKGTLRLMKIVILDGVPDYEVAVFGELGGLVSAMGAGKLEDLDFSAYDHVWNASGITTSWNASGGTSYFYPLIDYGLVSNNKVDYDIRALRPALYVREYLDKILTNAGYTFDSALFDSQRFRQLVIPNNQKTFQKLSSILFSVDRSTQYLAISNAGPFSPQNLKFVNLGILGSFTANADKNEFTYTGVDTLQTTFNIEFETYLYGQLYTFAARLLKNGVSVYEFFNTLRTNATPITFTSQVADLPVQIATGDVFKIELTVANSGGLGAYYFAINEGVWDIRTPNAVYININPGDTIDVSDTIPRNVLQKDFLASIIKLFNLYVYEDKLKQKHLNIEPYVDFYDMAVSGTVDWTYKMDRYRAIELTPMSELTSRFYDFKFKPDADYYNETYQKRYNETYGDRLYDSAYEFAQERATIDCIFSPSVLVGYSGVDKIVSAMYKLNVGVEETTATNIRILQTKKITGVTSWSIMDGVSTLQSGLTTYGYGGHYDDPDAPANDIHFGVPRELFFSLVTGAINVTQFNVYWSAYMAEITDKDSKLLRAWFKLSAKDIYDLDFSKLICIDGVYYRLNKIIDWNANEPDLCQCELLKVIEFFY